MSPAESFWGRTLRFALDAKPVVLILACILTGAGLHVLPFDPGFDLIPRDPIPVDAIPDVGENQQIVFTEWPGRSPRDVEDQITFPLTSTLLGVSGVRTVRSSSAFGFSTIHVIFEEDAAYYDSRTRILEKLASLPRDLLPLDVRPTLGPDATALGQVLWYTLEGRSPDGLVVGGWDVQELRSIQDWIVRYGLMAVPGVAEVASVGGFVREYQVDVDPDALLAHGVTLQQVARTVREANLDVGARTIEINRAEYVVRSRGLIESALDLEEAVVSLREDQTPIRLRDVAHVGLGPALRRGALDDAGAPAVGGVVIARFGENPLEVIQRVHDRIAELAPGLPERELEDGTISRVTVVPFYDRTGLIEETLATLTGALGDEMLVTLLVLLFFLGSLRGSFVVSLILPLGVLGALVAMSLFGVDANIMALGGIAIAIGTMVDMGIVMTENIQRRLEEAEPAEGRDEVVLRAAREVAPAVATSVATTVVSFLPVFALTASEGRLFRPLAYTKTFAMLAALVVTVLVVPAVAALLLRRGPRPAPTPESAWHQRVARILPASLVALLLAKHWSPLGQGVGLAANVLFVSFLVALLLCAFYFAGRVYPTALDLSLRHRGRTLGLTALVLVFGILSWRGFDGTFGWLPEGLLRSAPGQAASRVMPGLGREFMPAFDEGSFLYMPTTAAHASLGQAEEMLRQMDAAIAAIPEVDRVVGKLGRAETALDPAPVSMFETVITFIPEYRVEENGEVVRQWREHIQSPRDIWDEIARAAEMPGLTGAPMLMPIAARIVMLQSGMRAPMGIKVRGPSLESIEHFSEALEAQLREVSALRPETVTADRVVGKPYLEIDLDRRSLARHGLTVMEVQQTVQMALGGAPLTRTLEGRERYPVSVRYMREARGDVEAIERILVATPDHHQIPLSQLAEVRYVRGPQMIRSEDGRLTNNVLFDRRSEVSEVEAVEEALAFLEAREAAGELVRPEGVEYEFAGTYENQLRSEERLTLLVPLALALVFVLLYLQLRRVSSALIVYSGVLLALATAFTTLWLYGLPGLLDFDVLGTSMAELFRTGSVHMSVAAWVGMIAVVGIATDNGVVLATYLKQQIDASPVTTAEELRERIVEAGMRRLRPCLMTTATTLIALLPVITSRGRGADVMLPMALPSIGGMLGALLSLLVVPVLWSLVEERRLRARPPS